MLQRVRWGIVVVFSAAFAWVEAAAVIYLRTLVDRIEPYQANPLPTYHGLGNVEYVRELATLIMLLSVGLLAGRTRRTRIAYALLAFGVWDILYYAILKVNIGWPRTLLDWDILFLIPLPWWGPVLAPILISLLMILGATLATQSARQHFAPWPSRRALWMGNAGVLLALGIFMSDALLLILRDPESIRIVMPTSFNWPLFGLALLLMSAPILDMSTQLKNPSMRPEPLAPELHESNSEARHVPHERLLTEAEGSEWSIQ